jgi:hypothetical protein
MKKNDVFTFTAPNGVEVVGVVVAYMNLESHIDDGWDSTTVSTWLCYAQNRLFTYKHKYSVLHDSWGNTRAEGYGEYGETIVDYAVLPDYDEMLARYNDVEVAQAETQSGM